MVGDWLMNPGFYKNEDGHAVHGPNYVLNMDYELRKETKDEHTYPVDGWSWFDSEEEAYASFGLELPAVEKPLAITE
jgi:hypothetical protein